MCSPCVKQKAAADTDPRKKKYRRVELECDCGPTWSVDSHEPTKILMEDQNYDW